MFAPVGYGGLKPQVVGSPFPQSMQSFGLFGRPGRSTTSGTLPGQGGSASIGSLPNSMTRATEEMPSPQAGHWTLDGFDQMRQQQQPVPQPGPLGGSMRQPIDYDALRAELLPPEKKQGTFKKIASVLGPALLAAGGNQAGANAFIHNMARNRAANEDYRRDVTLKLAQMRHDDWARQNEADLRAANPFTVGRDRVMYNPASGRAQVLYDGPEDFEEYAATLNLQPGTQEYFQAVEDYVLKSSGPSAHDRDLELDDYRTNNDEHLEGVRYGNRVSMENLRQGHRRSMEGVRQSNRIGLRNRPPAKSSTGGLLGKTGGELPAVRTPEEASRLPSGTRFQTPDGRVKVVP